jgi:hypothetical protein
MYPPPDHPHDCIHHRHTRASMSGPAEDWCTHLDNELGECCEEDCPYEKVGEKPTTNEDCYEDYLDRKCTEYEESQW